MSDQLMDERLRAAGERWRAGRPASSRGAVDDVASDAGAPAASAAGATPDFEVLAPPARHRRWVASTAGMGIAAAVVVVALVIAGAIVVARRDNAPAADGRTDFGRVTGVVWHLIEVRTAAGQLVPAPKVTLEFGADGTFGAEDQCNELGGQVLARGSTLTFRQTETTQAGCTGPSLAVTNGIFFKAGNTHWSRGGSLLTLSKPGVGTLVYRLLPATPLLGTDWALIAVVDRTGNPGKLDRDSTLQISTSGSLLANDGLNELNAHVRVRGNSIVLGEVATSAVGSTRSSVVTESVDAVLSGTVRFAIDGDVLTLSKTGGPTLTYRPLRAVATAELSKHVWTLRSVEITSGGGGGITSTPAISLSRLTFDGEGVFTIEHTCYLHRRNAVISAHTVRLTGPPEVSSSCPDAPTVAAEQGENDVVDTLLSGTVTWAVHGTTLTLTKAGRGLTFTAQ